MFTGIIESLGEIAHISKERGNTVFRVKSPISSQLKIDQSVAHSGVCLTVTAVEGDVHVVTAIEETLNKTNLSGWKVGDLINLERCMPAHGRFDGHIVQGHVDQVAKCLAVVDTHGSWRYTFGYDPQLGNITVEKGSICVSGVSLTVVDSKNGQFGVAIIPYTYEHTNFCQLQPGHSVNLEFDIIGKYVQRIMQSRG